MNIKAEILRNDLMTVSVLEDNKVLVVLPTKDLRLTFDTRREKLRTQIVNTYTFMKLTEQFITTLDEYELLLSVASDEFLQIRNEMLHEMSLQKETK